MGSTTPTAQITKRKDYIEINSAEACRISSNKIAMKKRFSHGKIPTAEWFQLKRSLVNFKWVNDKKDKVYFCNKVNYWLAKYEKVIIKHKFSSKGNGLYLITCKSDFDDFCKGINLADLSSYIVERYYTYTKEYRLHINKNGCFYANRKMLRDDAKVRWHRHDNNSVWIKEDNPLFDKPTNWDDVIKSCISAMKSVGLDVAAFDIKIQSSKKKNPKWIILECNSAPGLGEIGLEYYKQMLIQLTNE